MNLQMTLLLQGILLVFGFYLLIRGADWFVDGASEIAERFGIPHLVVGLTIVAMGTSLPETAVSLAAALKGSADITIGNVLGSNLLNVLVILGVTSVLVPLKVAKTTVRYEIPFMILVTVLLMVLGMTGNQITFLEGVILWLFFLAYLFYLLRMAKQNQQAELEDQQWKPMWRLVLSIAAGVALIAIGSDVSVDAATVIARSIGFSERLIGLTIVALGTSLPELVTSVSAAKKGKADIAIGNVVGSNIFNILFVTGTTALVTPVAFASNFIPDAILSAAAGILLWFLIWKNQKLNKKGGIVLLAVYCIYMVYLIV